MKAERIIGSRYIDPFLCGFNYLLDGKYNSYENNYYNSVNREISEIGKKVSEFLLEHGECKAGDVAAYFGLTHANMKNKFAQTKIYESDNGRYIGILDENNNPVPYDGFFEKEGKIDRD